MTPFEHLKKSLGIDNLWFFILLLLVKNKSFYAYTLPKKIEEEFHFKTGKITPYRVLYRLELEGFVSSEEQENKRIYKITELGKEELAKAKDFIYDFYSRYRD